MLRGRNERDQLLLRVGDAEVVVPQHDLIAKVADPVQANRAEVRQDVLVHFSRALRSSGRDDTVDFDMFSILDDGLDVGENILKSIRLPI